MKERVIVALDVDTREEVRELCSLLSGEVGMFKVGMQAFYRMGRELLEELRRGEAGIFLDLKLHDIPNTVAQSCRALTGLGVQIVNVHASGGRDMMRAAREAVGDEAARLSIPRPRVIAVTVLTSLGDGDLTEIGYRAGARDAAAGLARLAQESGLDGVVCSPWEAAGVREACGPGFLTVTPGVRPSAGGTQDQKRVMTPAEAIRQGADYLVIGRPITQAGDPVQAVRSIVREMEEAC